jgi:glutamate formiminotransferase
MRRTPILPEERLPEGVPEPAEQPVALAVPNVSEGRDDWVVRELVAAATSTGARLLDLHADPDHDRSVLTLAGHPLAVVDALVELAGACLDRIDLRRRRGAHPRTGALDVAPLVARTPLELPLARELARAVADRIGDGLGLPVFMYGEVSPGAEVRRPHDLRRLGLEGIEREMAEGRLAPDAGPPRLHPTAGAVLVGARLPLIAWNVWLPDGTLDQARAIAARVREAGGGPPALRALGLWLPRAGAAQVSMNLEDYRRTPPGTAVAAVRREAERLGTRAGASELVGLIPVAALARQSPSALGLAGFRPGQVLEAQMRARL